MAVSDSGARGRGCVVYINSPKITGNSQEAVAPSRHDWKIVDWDVKEIGLHTVTCTL